MSVSSKSEINIKSNTDLKKNILNQLNILLNDKDHYFNYCPYCTYVNSLSFSNQKCKNFEK